MLDDDRLMLLTISRRAFLDLLRGEVVSDLSLPADAIIQEVHNHYESRGFVLVIRSSTFEPIAPGCTIPNMPPIGMRIRQKVDEAQFAQQPPVAA